MRIHERKYLSALRGVAVLLAASFCLLSCSSEETQASDTPATQDPSAQTSVQPSASTAEAEISPEPSTTTSGSPVAVPAASATAAARTTSFAGSAWGITFEFEHPSSWTIEPHPGSPFGDSFNIYNEDESPMGTLSIEPTYEHPCLIKGCESYEVTHLNRRSSGDHLLDWKPFYVETLVMDLTEYPAERERIGWHNNVRLVVGAHRYEWQDEVIDPYSITSTVFVGGQGQEYNAPAMVHFDAVRDFSTWSEAVEYAETQEHWEIQSMVASFTARGCTGEPWEPESRTASLPYRAPDLCASLGAR